MPQVGILASHGGYVTFTIHNRVKIHNLNQKKLKTIYSIDVTFTIHNRVKIHNLNQKKLKTIYSIKKKKKTNQSSRLLPLSMSNSLEKNPRSLKPRIKSVYIISSII